jgi:hypothetical protein
MIRLRFLSGYGWFCLVLLLAAKFAHAANHWEQPASQLATQIAEILGSGQAQLVLSNRSTIEASEIAPIRRMLEQDLRSHGVALSGAESANIIRVTLSENTRERLWVAEVIEGNRTQVAMVHVDRETLAAPAAQTGIVLEKKSLWSSDQPDGPVLAALETRAGLVILEQEEIVVLAGSTAAWREEKRWNLDAGRLFNRDPRGMLQPAPDGIGFTAVLPGRLCDGSYAAQPDASEPTGNWSLHCRESDDPWPVELGKTGTGAVDLHAFYNASRNYFTGVITPNPGMDITPFYSLAVLPHPTVDHLALLIHGIDGKVQLTEGNSLKPVAGTRDWGSDFAALHSACGAGTQILASASGEAENDSLRAYELASQEAVAVSAPLEMGGTITALWTAPDGAAAMAIVRRSAKEYEVDRVSALCL